LCHGEIHLGQAKARSAASGTTLGSITKGDARCLSAQSNSADAVLLLGERSDRLMALREARRILKPKGVLIAAAISRFASLIDGLARGFFRDSDFRKIVARDLATGSTATRRIKLLISRLPTSIALKNWLPKFVNADR
jgi:ubiquinone/menaquinone biosynthesis C-methylase UbiE